jgi:hypothetical protein
MNSGRIAIDTSVNCHESRNIAMMVATSETMLLT